MRLEEEYGHWQHEFGVKLTLSARLFVEIQVTAIEAASLEIVLDNPGSFTVFAPDNSAFEDVSSDLLNKLLNPVWKPQLQDLLLYHVLGTEVYSSDLVDGSKAPTLNFQEDVITINTDPARVNEVSIIGPADIEASNGVVHPVSSVLVPPSATNTIVDLVVGVDDFTALLEALSAAGLGTALDGTGPFTVFGEFPRAACLCSTGFSHLTAVPFLPSLEPCSCSSDERSVR